MREASDFLKYLCEYYKCDLVVIDQWHLLDKWISYCKPQDAKRLKKYHDAYNLKRNEFSVPKNMRYFAALCKDSKIWLNGLNVSTPHLALESLRNCYVNRTSGALWVDNIYRKSRKGVKAILEDHLNGTCKAHLKLFAVLKNG